MLYKSYVKTKNLQSAIDLLIDKKYQTPYLLSGGTDIFLQMKNGSLKSDLLIDISEVKELKKVRNNKNEIHIGAAVTFDELIESKILREELPLLVDASKKIGSPQIRNMGTIGGNICTASAAADLIPCLFALDAQLILAGEKGERVIPIRDFIISNRKTSLRPGEILKEIMIKKTPSTSVFAFEKLGLREGMSISIVNTAVALNIGTKSINDSSIIVGCVGPTAIVCKLAQDELKNQKPNNDLFTKAGEIAVQEITPIDDIRGSTAFRKHLAKALVNRCLNKAYAKWQSVQGQ